ncbi:MAG TPA: hypothetical protein VFH90_05550 [Candidatus Limnocylindria bacterium]|nr:hypothetical protein [Candidatus Limnocylindria bacterium]
MWASEDIDPAPGRTVTSAIAQTITVPEDTVTAAVFLLTHPAGNGAEVWVFRAEGVASGDAVTAWARTESLCGGPVTAGSLAQLPAVIAHREFLDQCEPRYLVQLDADTVAAIIDDGGYSGNMNPSRVPYRPLSDIAWIVQWLQQKLMTVQLQPGVEGQR